MITYITPHKDYRTRVKAYRRCPEIRHKIDELSWNVWYTIVIAVPIFVVLGIPMLIVLLGNLIERGLANVMLPKCMRPRASGDIMYELHQILSWREIRARIDA